MSVHSDAGGLVKRLVDLFVNGDLSLIGQDEEQSLPCFRPLAVRLMRSVDASNCFQTNSDITSCYYVWTSAAHVSH